MFAATTDILDSVICKGLGVLVSKEDRRKVGNDLRKVREATTKPIDPKLGVSKHFISLGLGEAEDGDDQGYFHPRLVRHGHRQDRDA